MHGAYSVKYEPERTEVRQRAAQMKSLRILPCRLANRQFDVQSLRKPLQEVILHATVCPAALHASPDLRTQEKKQPA